MVITGTNVKSSGKGFRKYTFAIVSLIIALVITQMVSANTSATLRSAPAYKDRVLTEDDKKQLREQVTDLTRSVRVEYQRGNNEAKQYANEIIVYLKSIGFKAGPLFYSPPARGRFTVTEKDMGKTRVYLVDVLANALD